MHQIYICGCLAFVVGQRVGIECAADLRPAFAGDLFDQARIGDVFEISMTLTALRMVAAVALSSTAATPTSATATSACISAEANESTTPRRQVSPLATR
jgi:hypothetical protein